MKKKILLSSILTIVLCISLITGATFALFTSESKVNIAVTSGKVEMIANVVNLQTWSLEDDLSKEGRLDGSFTQGGSANFSNNVLTINKIIPGDKVSFTLTGKNNSNVSVQYRMKVACLDGEKLLDGLKVTINNEEYFGLNEYVSAWETLKEGFDMKEYQMSVELPKTAGNYYQDLKAELLISVEAIQGNATVNNEEHVLLINYWDQTANIEELLNNTFDEEKLVLIKSAESFAAFRDLVNSGKNYQGYTVKLLCDINLEGNLWTPIGTNADSKNKFYGTFDGNNHTIYNLVVEQGAGYHAAGLFGALNGTVRNLNIENALVTNISSGTSTDNGTAVVAGSIYTSGTIENVKVNNALVNGNRYVAVVAGYVYGNIIDCIVTNSEVYAKMDNLTGTYDNGDKAGIIAGYFSGEHTYQLVNNTVDGCLVDAERDVAGLVGVASNIKEFENNKVSNTTVIYHTLKSYQTASEIVSERVFVNVPSSNTAENVFVILEPTSVDTVKDALDKGMDVTLESDLIGPANDSNGYGVTGVYVSGNTIDGNGYTLSISKAGGTWDSAVATNGGTIKNLNVEGAFRGIFTGGLTSDLYLDNVCIDKVCYTFNADGTDAFTYSLIVTNSKFYGWTSYSNIFNEVSFTNCLFGKGTGAYTYAFLRPYNDTTFTNCVFEDGYSFDSTKAISTFVNCYVGTTLITNENVTTLLGSNASNIVIANK